MFGKSTEQKNKEQGLQDEFMEICRSIAVNAKNIRENLTKVTDEKKTDRQAMLDIIDPVIGIKEKSIENLLNKTDMVFNQGIGDPVLWARGRALGDDYGDQVERIRDKWDEFKNIWDRIRVPDPNPQNKKADLDMLCNNADYLDELLCSIISHSNLVTIPSRLNECLADIWPGQPLNFSSQFGDELSNRKCSKWFLEYFTMHPAIVNGVVIPAEGIVISASPEKWRQILSFVLVSFTALFGIILAWSSAWLLLSMNYSMILAVPNGLLSNAAIKTIDTSVFGVTNYVDLAIPFVVCYCLILAGAIAHILTGALKQQRKGSANLAIESWLRWFHVNEIKNFFASISLYIAFFGLILFFKSTDYLTAFFIGYSIDSFVDLFLNRFMQTATIQTGELEESFSRTGERTPSTS
jgi:hypothetical protein